MGFLTFIWKTAMWILSFIAFIVIEIFIFSLIFKILMAAGMPILASISLFVFTIWIIADIFIKIFLGGTKSVIRYILRY